jgi:hypothetical protein
MTYFKKEKYLENWSSALVVGKNQRKTLLQARVKNSGKTRETTLR